MMKRLPVVIMACMCVPLVLLVIIGGGDDVHREFHVTLADPDMYADGVYVESFTARPGEYTMQFVPNGDSPPALYISVEGPDTIFEGNYRLQGTLHDTGISEYYTWEYLGPDGLVVPQSQTLTITIDPKGSTDGSVSVSLIRDLPSE